MMDILFLTLWIRVWENVTTRALRLGFFPRRSQLRARIVSPDVAGAVTADLATCKPDQRTNERTHAQNRTA